MSPLSKQAPRSREFIGGADRTHEIEKLRAGVLGTSLSTDERFEAGSLGVKLYLMSKRDVLRNQALLRLKKFSAEDIEARTRLITLWERQAVVLAEILDMLCSGLQSQALFAEDAGKVGAARLRARVDGLCNRWANTELQLRTYEAEIEDVMREAL